MTTDQSNKLDAIYNNCVKTLKTYDFKIPKSQHSFSKSVTDIPNATEIIMAGLIYRGWEGWNSLNIIYDSSSFTVQFSSGDNSGTSYGTEIVRVLYT